MKNVNAIFKILSYLKLLSNYYYFIFKAIYMDVGVGVHIKIKCVYIYIKIKSQMSLRGKQKEIKT